jgi:hypothetical protein
LVTFSLHATITFEPATRSSFQLPHLHRNFWRIHSAALPDPQYSRAFLMLSFRPFVGFLFAVPALVYGVMNARIVPGLADPANSDIVFGVPLILQILARFSTPTFPWIFFCYIR